MIFTIFTIIVFLAELILTIFIISSLVKFDKTILDLNEIVILAKPKLKDIGHLTKEISNQLVEMTESFVKRLKLNNEEFALKQLSKVLLALLLWKINSKTITKLRKTKVVKLLGKGLSLLEIMV